MVAIISGSDLGLNTGSASALNRFGGGAIGNSAQGRNGERAYVNIATGNLVLQDVDGVLEGLGLDVASLRTYNSQGGANFTNNDGWLNGQYKSVVKLGDGSYQRTDIDGSTTVYVWNAERQLYVETLSPGGAADTIQVNGDTSLTWTSGGSGATERYQGSGSGLIQSSQDSSGNVLSYTYTGNLLTRVTTADGESINYSYSGNNLMSVSTTLKSGTVLNLITYTYDTSNRLSSVSVTLNPEGLDKVTAGETLTAYTTSYTYDGTSNRVASITQPDGTHLAFTYVLADGQFKIATVTDGNNQVTSFAYNTTTNTTTVTDPLGVAASYQYDSKDQLTQVRTGITAGYPTGQTLLTYSYTSTLGEVASITDGLGRVTTLSYDEKGNLTKQVDGAGDTTEWTYNGANQVKTETRYATPAQGSTGPSQAQTTRYVYDASNATLLRFGVSPNGRVTEYRYNSQGLRISTIRYTAGTYDTSALGLAEVPTEGQMETWQGAQDLTQSQRTDFAYDFRGQLQSSTSWGSTDSTGAGVSGKASTTQYVYNQRGELLLTTTPDGLGSSHTVYDGFGRVVYSEVKGGDLSTATVTQYDDANGKTTVTLANGLVSTSTFDGAGRLVSVAQAGGGSALGTTQYAYDADGRLLMTTDPTGRRNWTLYDMAGRKLADIDSAGGLTKYVYDGASQLVQTIRYVNAVSTSGLVDVNGKPTTANGEATLSGLAVTPTAQDQKTWNFYDQAGRLTYQVDALGYVTQTQYDGTSHVLAVTRLATPMDPNQLSLGVSLELSSMYTRLDSATSLTVGASAQAGSMVTLTARVTGQTPSGVVVFCRDGVAIGSSTLVDGQATLSLNSLPVGNNNLTAMYLGDGLNAQSTSAAGVQVVSRATSTTVLRTTSTLGDNSQTLVGAGLTLTAQVSGANPTGTVTFYNGGTALGTANLVNGLASLVVSSLTAGTANLSVKYAGDTSNAASTSAAVSETVMAVPTTTTTTLTTTLPSNGTAVTVGASVTLTATIAGATPSGIVSFYAGSLFLGSARVSGGTAALATMAIPGGSQSLTALYSGDGGNSSSLSAVKALTVTPATATVTLSSSSPTSSSSSTGTGSSSPTAQQGTPVVLTAKVTGSTGRLPSGTMTFYNGSTVLGTASVVNGIAALTVSNLPVGSDSLKAVYGGDASNLTCTSAVVTETITASLASSVTALSASTSTYSGGALTLTATVTGSGTLGGKVTFLDGNTILGKVAVTNGVATLSDFIRSTGSATIRATYSGDASNTTSVSGDIAVNFVVAKSGNNPGKTSPPKLAVSSPMVGAGCPIVLTVTRPNSAMPSGTVVIYDGATVLGSVIPVGNVACLTLDSLSVGSHSLTARYSGDTLLGSDASNAVSVTVSSVATSTTTLTASTPDLVTGGLRLVAQVVSTSPVPPTGTVTFFNGSTVLGTATVTDGLATLLVGSLPVGTASLTASYGGDSRSAISTSTAVSKTIAARTDLTSLTGATIACNGALGVFVNVYAGGTVTFLTGTTVLGVANVIYGVATLQGVNLPLGSLPITALYSGDATNAAGSLSFTTSITPASTTTTLAVQPANSLGQGKPLVLMAQVLGAKPSGTVTFYDGSTVLGTGTLSGGMAALTVSNLGPGAHSLKAVYAGDTRNTTSSSTVIAEAVVGAPAGVTLSRSASSVAQGGSLTLTATVTGNAPSGVVTFLAGTSVLGTASVVNGTATLVASGINLPVGTANLRAVYGGDGSNGGGFSATLSETVTAGAADKLLVSRSMQDRTVTSIINQDGLLRATIDGEGFLTEYGYDAAGRQVQTIRHATRVTNFADAASVAAQVATARATDSLTGLVPTSGDDISTFTYYDGKGQVIAQVDGEGYLTEYTYDADGQLTQTTRYATKAKGPITITSSLSSLRPTASAEDHTNLQAWDALGRLSTSTNAEGTVTSYVYDSLGRVIRTTTALGTTDQRIGRVKYDLQGRVVAELSGVGAAMIAAGGDEASIWSQYQTTYAYDAAGRRISQTDALGHKTVFLYDDAGRLRYTVDAAGSVMEQTYDALGHVLTTTRYATALTGGNLTGLVGGLLSDSANQSTKSALDVAKAADAVHNATTTYTYNADGELEKTQQDLTVGGDKLGGTTTRVYNAFGEVVQTTQVYTPFGEVAQATQSPTGSSSVTSTQQFDRRGLGIETLRDTEGFRVETRAEYDAFGRLVKSWDGLNHLTQSSYDKLGRVVTVTDALTKVQRTSYDAFSRTLSQVDRNGNTTSYRYNTANRTMTTTLADGSQVVTTHTRQGLTLSVRDGRQNTTSYTYNEDGQLLTVTGPLGKTLENAYDVAGRLDWSKDAKGIQTKYEYDAVNRVLTRTLDAEGLNLTTSYAYDAKGQQITVTDPTGMVTKLDYDLKGEVVTQTVDDGGLKLVTSFTYDQTGHTLTVVDGGVTTQYRYDSLGRRTQSIVDPTGKNLVTKYTYDANGNVSSVEDPDHRMTYYVYNEDNRLSWTVDGVGGVTYHDYDANGNETDRISYANTINVASWTKGTPPTVAPDTAHDVQVRTVYDKQNRVRYTLSSTGDGTQVSVVEHTYDANGNETSRTAYAGTIPTSTAATVSAVQTALNGRTAASTPDATIRRVFDEANRLIWSVDGTGAVTRQFFDANGNLTKQIAYANRISAGADPTTVTASALDRVNLMVYDAAGRRTYTVDALGGVTQAVYNKAGRVVQTIAFAQRVAVPTVGTDPASFTPPSVSNNPANYALTDRVTRFVYDTAGRLTYTLDAMGALSATSYDASGRVVAQTAFANLASTALPSGTTISSLAVNGNTYTAMNGSTALCTWTADAVNDRTTRYAYDSAGGRIATIDALGFVTGMTYDGAGRVVSTTLYHQPVTGSTTTPVATPGLDRTTTFSYDAAGRLSSSTDALGQTESYTYDGVGNKVTFTNKKQATWDYVYDAAGRLIQEIDPAVSVTTISADANGNLTPTPTPGVRLVTQLSYDGLGNLLSRTEAAGTPSARTTSYQYDALGHQVKVIYPAVGVYNTSDLANLTTDGSGASARTETPNVELSTTTVYDSFGDAIANVDVGNNISYKAYDALGHVRYDIDAMGYVTGYERNTFGEVTALTRYSAAPTTLNASLAAIPTETQVRTAIGAGSLTGRTIQTDYDALGRAVQVTPPSAYVNDGTDDSQAYTTGAVTRTRYNAFGEVFQSKVLAKGPNGPDGTGAVWAVTTSYHNAVGQQIATVDALGYVTTYAYDEAGNLQVQVEYATALPEATPLSGWNWSAAPAKASDLAIAHDSKDRTTTFTYDLLNQKLTQTQKGVTVCSGVTLDEDGKPTDVASSVQDVTTSYGYDVLGNQTSTTDALGNTTYSFFDVLGRTVAVLAPSRTDAIDGSALTPLTEFKLDAFGKVVVKTEYEYGGRAVTDDNGKVVDYQALSTAPGKLSAGQTLTVASTSVKSADGHYELKLGADGSLALLECSSGHVEWTAKTAGSGNVAGVQITGADRFCVQTDGNLVLYKGTTALWTSGTAGKGGTTLTVQKDGNLVFTDANSKVIWSSDNGVASVGWAYEGITGYLAAVQAPNTVPLYRLSYGAQTTYTSSDTERDSLISAGWTNWQPQGYLECTASTSNVALYKLTKTINGTLGTLLTTDQGEISSAVAAGWVNKGSIGYIRTQAAQGIRPLFRIFNGTTSCHLYTHSQPEAFSASHYAALDPSQDRVTLTQYDSHGNAIETVNAEGVKQFSSYDKAGHLAKTWQNVSGNTYYTAFEYDALGCQVGILTPGTTSVSNGTAIVAQAASTIKTELKYNAFGEVVGRGSYTYGQRPTDDTDALDEYFEYDPAGHLWRTNQEDGTVKVLLYDLQGRQTVQITSNGSAGSNFPGSVGLDLKQAVTSAQGADQLGSIGLRRTVSQLDLLGRALCQMLPTRKDNGTTPKDITPQVDQTFDRWGNVLTQTVPYVSGQASVATTTFEYAHNNQVIKQIQPPQTVETVRTLEKMVIGSSSGGTTTVQVKVAEVVNPTTQIYYNALGQQVAVKDANGHINGQTWDGAGQLATEIHADGGVIRHAYNAFGDQTQITDAEGNITHYQYDRLGENTAILHPNMTVASADVSNAVTTVVRDVRTTSVYDELGRKVLEDDESGGPTRYIFDLRGNQIARINADNSVSRTAYDLQGKQTAAQDANEKLQTWGYDDFGQLTAHMDLSGKTFGFTYDKANQLVHQTNTYGQDLSYAYDAAGQLTQISDVDPYSGNTVTTYAYNARGQRTLERVEKNDGWASMDKLWYADVNGDGKVDQIGRDKSGRIHVNLSGGSGNWISSGAIGEDTGRMLFGDVNGDGKADLVYTTRGGVVHTALSDGTGFGNTWASDAGLVDDASGIRLADINGDGKSDLTAIKDGCVTTFISDGIHYAKTWTSAKNINLYSEMTTFADVNGDGRDDAIGAYYYTGYGYSGYMLTLGLGYANGSIGSSCFFAGGGLAFQVGDVNGDGRVDIVSKWASGKVSLALNNADGISTTVTWTSATSYIATDATIRLADVNGDGKSDLLCQNTDGTLKVAFSTGSGFGAFTWSSAAGLGDYTLADVNGDGKADLITRPSGGAAQVALATGTGFGTATSTWFTDGAATPYQDQELSYDSLGRLVSVVSKLDALTIQYSYDLVGNRMSTTADFTYNGTQQHQKLYFAYDEMNRQILADGAKNNDADDIANITASQGHILEYDKNGNRTSDTYWGKLVSKTVANGTWVYGGRGGTYSTTSQQDGQGVTSRQYHYDGMGRLSTVTVDKATITTTTTSVNGVTTTTTAITHQDMILDTRKYDGVSRLVVSGPNGGLDNDYVKALTDSNSDLSGASTTTYRYDVAGRLLSQHVHNEADDSSYDIAYKTYDAAGNLLSYTLTQKGLTTTQTTTLSAFEAYKESSVYKKIVGSTTVQGTMYDVYDANGFQIGVTNLSSTASAGRDAVATTKTLSADSRSFVNDANGHVLAKYQGGRVLRQVVANGEVIGIYGTGADLNDTDAKPGDAPTFINQANFDLGFTPVTNSYPAASTGSYPVRSGESLESIALNAYGDASLWYLIAEANGLLSNQDLRVGQVLTIPTKVGSTHNTSATQNLYNPAKIVGSTAPNLATPKPKVDSGGGGGCGGIGMIIVIIVVIVASIFTAGAAAVALGAVSSGTGIMAAGAAAMVGGGGLMGIGAAVACSAIGAAVGSVIGQGVGMALGVQDKFSWSQVGMSALSAAVSAGVGGALGAGAQATQVGQKAGQAAEYWTQVASAAGRAAVANTATQGIAVACGMQDHFSWTSVAASAVGAGVGSAVGQSLNGIKFTGDGFTDGVIKGTARGFAAGASTSLLRGGKIAVVQVASDAFGNALGESIKDEMLVSASAQTTPVKTSTGFGRTVSVGSTSWTDYGIDFSGPARTFAPPLTDTSTANAMAVDGDLGSSSPVTGLFKSPLSDANFGAFDQGGRWVTASSKGLSGMTGGNMTEMGYLRATYGLNSDNLPNDGRRYFIPDNLQPNRQYTALAQDALDTSNSIAVAKAEAAQSAAGAQSILFSKQPSEDEIKSLINGTFGGPFDSSNSTADSMLRTAVENYNRKYSSDGSPQLSAVTPDDVRQDAIYDAKQSENARRFSGWFGLWYQAPAMLSGVLATPVSYGGIAPEMVNGAPLSSPSSVLSGGYGSPAVSSYTYNTSVGTWGPSISGQSSAATTSGLSWSFGSSQVSTLNDGALGLRYGNWLSRDLSAQEFVYRLVKSSDLRFYEAANSISGRGGSPTYFSLDTADSIVEHMSGAQMKPGEYDTLLRIPTSELVNPSVPRPFGYAPPTSRPIYGWEYYTNAYPNYGSGGFRQFEATTKSFSPSWVVQK
ncbi:Ig-like domain repeat protein [Holophaga foetida]|uniref:Ig-like domain repeat protein n=1 Tax=Holophaga foetida TaxID=35839 RepID=UPI000247A432|nr:Ig-like domain repeat protein [Holophaga foetida]